MPPSGRPAPSPTIGGERLTVVGVCEWAVDLDLGLAVPIGTRPVTIVASTGFVDFDAIESVHVSSSSASRS